MSWTTPWTSPGGDIGPGVVGSATYLTGRSPSPEMRVDITEAISGIVAGEIPNYGLLLLPAGGGAGGFRDEVAGHLDSAEDFQITILYE